MGRSGGRYHDAINRFICANGLKILCAARKVSGKFSRSITIAINNTM
jgi:hypothetical protein